MVIGLLVVTIACVAFCLEVNPFLFIDNDKYLLNNTSFHTVILDTNVAYKSQYEAAALTPYDFFNETGLNTLPKTLGRWNGQDIQFNAITYSFYETNEIFGRTYTNAKDDFIWITLIQGPKLHWHNPENCYIFSDWSVVDKAIEPVEIAKNEDNLFESSDTIYVNKLIVQKNSIKHAVLYLYALKNRFSVEDVSLIIISAPIHDEIKTINREKAFIKELFQRTVKKGIGGPKSIDEQTRDKETLPIPYAEDNPPIIKDWLVIGSWSSSDANVSQSYPPADWDRNWLDEEISSVSPSAGEFVSGKSWQIHNGCYGIINLDSIFEPTEMCYAYAFEYIYLNSTRTVLLDVCSDEGVRVWLNGELVHSRVRKGPGGALMYNRSVERGASLEDVVTITLDKGWNRLLLEIYQWKGSWEFYVKFRDLDGKPITNIEFSTIKPEAVSNQHILTGQIGQPLLIWQIGYSDACAEEFSLEWYVDDDYYIGESFKEFERAVSKGDPITNIHFQLSAKEVNQSHKLTFGVNAVDIADIGYVMANISVNGHFVCTYQYPRDRMMANIQIHKDILKEANNIITLEWAGGGNYVVWDYVSLE